MAKDKKGFILYADQKALFEQLPNDKAGELIKFIFAYVNDENPETDDLIINLAFTPIKQQLKRDLIKFEETKEKRSEAGKAGANKRWQNIANDSKRISDIAKIAVNVNDNVNVKEKVIDINIRKQEFANSLIPFVDVYGKDMIREFYDYWSETTLNNKKIKYELEKTWSTERRLKTWSKNSAKFGGALPKQEQEKFKAPWQ